jgi:hypothetical protein
LESEYDMIAAMAIVAETAYRQVGVVEEKFLILNK